MEDKKNSNENSDKNIRASFTDAELENALADFEREFNSANQKSEENKTASNADNSSKLSSNSSGKFSEDSIDENDINDAMNKFEEAEFKEDLEELLGKKAKAAVILAHVDNCEILAALCKLAGVSADCFTEENGSVAVLHNLQNDEPEIAINKFIKYFKGIEGLLIVNRANRLEAKLYKYKVPTQDMVAPMVLSMFSDRVEDLLIGVATLEDLKKQDIEIINSDLLKKSDIPGIFSKYGKYFNH